MVPTLSILLAKQSARVEVVVVVALPQFFRASLDLTDIFYELLAIKELAS